VIIGLERIKVEEEKMKAIINWPVSKLVKKI